jgi:hypothetical protein
MGNDGDNGKIDRRIKVTPDEVKEKLEDSPKHITIAELSEAFDVTPETIRKKLRVLRADGETIIHDGNGICLLDSVEDLADAGMVWDFMRWCLAVGKGITVCLVPIKQHLPQTKRLLRERMSPEERHELAASIVRVKGLLEQAEIEDELS